MASVSASHRHHHPLEWGNVVSRSSRKTFYDSVTMGPLKLKIGDVVHLKSEQEHLPFIARLAQLWSREGVAGGFCECRWYYRPEDTNTGRRAVDQRNEIFLSRFSDENSLAKVLEVVRVTAQQTLASAATPSPAKSKRKSARLGGVVRAEDGVPVYLCTQSFDPTTGAYTRLKGDEVHEDEGDKFEGDKGEGDGDGDDDQVQSKSQSKSKKHGRRARPSPVSSSDSWEASSFSSVSEFSSLSGSDSGSSGSDRKQQGRGGTRRGGAVKRKKRLLPARPSKSAKTAAAASASSRRGGKRSYPMPPTAPPALAMLAAGGGGSTFSRACQLLQLSAIPGDLPCREKERDDIFDFLFRAIADGGCGGCLYISGVPGTGKTVTVHQVVRALQGLSASGELAPFQFVEINGMRLTEPPQVYSLLWKGITGAHATPSHAAAMLESRFTTPSPHRQPCVVLVDELDLLVSRKQTVLYNLFEWPTNKHSRLVVIGIANTMDLPERLLPRVHSRLGLRRLDFQPYTREQLSRIVTYRLMGLEIYDEFAVELCARRIASVSGDIRKALEICRRAAELAEAGGVAHVTLDHVNSAAESFFSSTRVVAVREGCSVHEQLILTALLLETRRLGSVDVPFENLATRHRTLAITAGHPPLPAALLVVSVARLADSRLLLRETSNAAAPIRFSKIRLNVGADDLEIALEKNEFALRALQK
jgi:Cdc6-like AAA superfamily ATPase